MLVICSFLWRIPQPLKHTFLILLLIILPISFFPFSHLFLTCDIGVVGFAVNLVKFLHILITVSFDDTRQADFQKVYFLVLAVNPALQFPFLVSFTNPFRLSRSSSNSLRFLSETRSSDKNRLLFLVCDFRNLGCIA